jgi:predicted nucleic acid-binding protein
MIVVSDTSPLNYLVLIGQTDLLPKMFGRVVTCAAVIEEMLHPAAPDAVRRWAGNIPEWLEVMTPMATTAIERLGAGEADAIALAEQLNAELLLIDDEFGKQVATERGLHVTGTLGILDQAAAHRLLDIESAINALRETTFRFPEKLIQKILERHRQQ